jgi:SOS-response transcriptional repressor LexA
MDELTDRQREILAFIREHSAQTGMSPSRADKSVGKCNIRRADQNLSNLLNRGELEYIHAHHHP